MEVRQRLLDPFGSSVLASKDGVGKFSLQQNCNSPTSWAWKQKWWRQEISVELLGPNNFPGSGFRGNSSPGGQFCEGESTPVTALPALPKFAQGH